MLSALIIAALLAGAYAHPEQLVETEWVASHLDDPGIRIVDMRSRGYEQGHIPGAARLAPEAIRDAKAAPTFLPTPAAFEAMMARLGISNTTRVIVYDERGGIYAARLWWILNYFGHENVALVNGGWTKWSAESRPVSPDVPVLPAGRFTARPEPRWVATAADVLAAIDKPSVKIIDARTEREIQGAPQQNIRRGGFVPSSVPIYWEDLLDPKLRTFKPADELKQIYESRGVLPSHEVIAYCLVGMRASVDLFALHLLGHDKLKNYYGAWEEWGNRDDTPIATKTP
jgi:thiosulfate/3-mercaptopyruvate sulfurtransferase